MNALVTPLKGSHICIFYVRLVVLSSASSMKIWCSYLLISKSILDLWDIFTSIPTSHQKDFNQACKHLTRYLSIVRAICCPCHRLLYTQIILVTVTSQICLWIIETVERPREICLHQVHVPRFHSANILITVGAPHQGTKKKESMWTNYYSCRLMLGNVQVGQIFVQKSNPQLSCLFHKQIPAALVFYNTCSGFFLHELRRFFAAD